MNTYDASQMHTLYNQAGIDSTSRSKHAHHANVHSKKMSQAAHSQANLTHQYNQQKPKRSNAVVLLGGHLNRQIQLQQSQRQQLRTQHPSGNRESQNSDKFESQKEKKMRQIANLQYMASAGRNRSGKSNSLSKADGTSIQTGVQSASTLLQRH